VDDQYWTPAVYHATPATPEATVRVASTGKRFTMPYQPSFRPDPAEDAQLVVIDDATRCSYELQAFDPSTMTAHSGATFDVVTGTGAHTEAGVAGAQISLLGGLITARDVASGSIDHALRYATPINVPGHVSPGTSTYVAGSDGIPSGELMRLDPSLDLSKLDLSAFQLLVATALKRYGAYNTGASGSFKLYSESVVDGSTYTSQPEPLPWSVASHLQFGSTTFARGTRVVTDARTTGCGQGSRAPARK